MLRVEKAMEIRNKSCTIFLPDELSASNYYSDKPFTIFEIHPFVSQSSFRAISKEIHGLDDFDYIAHGMGDKKRSSVNLSNIYQLQDGAFKDFCSCVFSGDFFKWFKRTHLPYFERKPLNVQITFNPNSLFMRIIRRLFKISRRLIGFVPIPLGFYYTEVEYSSLLKGAFLSPHTDVRHKRLSFVFYLPLEHELSETEKTKLGTVFWKPKETATSPLKRFDCGLLKGDERSRFYEDHEVLRVATYDVNKAACFIKSDNSWHSVEKNTTNYDRRAIVINVYEL